MALSKQEIEVIEKRKKTNRENITKAILDAVQNNQSATYTIMTNPQNEDDISSAKSLQLSVKFDKKSINLDENDDIYVLSKYLDAHDFEIKIEEFSTYYVSFEDSKLIGPPKGLTHNLIDLLDKVCLDVNNIDKLWKNDIAIKSDLIKTYFINIEPHVDNIEYSYLCKRNVEENYINEYSIIEKYLEEIYGNKFPQTRYNDSNDKIVIGGYRGFGPDIIPCSSEPSPRLGGIHRFYTGNNTPENNPMYVTEKQMIDYCQLRGFNNLYWIPDGLGNGDEYICFKGDIDELLKKYQESKVRKIMYFPHSDATMHILSQIKERNFTNIMRDIPLCSINDILKQENIHLSKQERIRRLNINKEQLQRRINHFESDENYTEELFEWKMEIEEIEESIELIEDEIVDEINYINEPNNIEEQEERRKLMDKQDENTIYKTGLSGFSKFNISI